MSAGKLFQMAVAECLKTPDDRLVRRLVTVKRLTVIIINNNNIKLK